MTLGFRRTGRTRRGSSVSTRGRWGRRGNCQIGVSVHAVGARGTVPLGWALYLPEDWCEDAERRRKAKIPDEVVFKTKSELGVELVERAAGWDVPKAPVLGDHAYGENTWLRDRLDQAGCEYVLSVWPDHEGVRAGHHLRGANPQRADDGRGAVPAAARPPARADRRADRRARSDSAQTVAFRDGPDGEPVTSRFIFARVHAAHGWRDDQHARMARGRRGSPARGMADRRMARGRGRSRPTTGSQTSPPTPRPSGSRGSRGCAGRSSLTTNNSRASSASTTTRAAHGSGGITTPRW